MLKQSGSPVINGKEPYHKGHHTCPGRDLSRWDKSCRGVHKGENRLCFGHIYLRDLRVLCG